MFQTVLRVVEAVEWFFFSFPSPGVLPRVKVAYFSPLYISFKTKEEGLLLLSTH